MILILKSIDVLYIVGDIIHLYMLTWVLTDRSINFYEFLSFVLEWVEIKTDTFYSLSRAVIIDSYF